MNRIELDDTDLTVPDLADLARHGTVILTRHGKPLAAVKPLPGGDWESLSLASNPRFVALIEDSRRSYSEQGGKSLDEVRQEFGLTAKPRRRTKRPRKRTRSRK